MDPAVASIIASGAVAVFAILGPILSSLVADSLKWRRETKAGSKDKIEAAASDLLKALAPFRSGDAEAARKMRYAQVYSEMLAAFYAWEQAISPFCSDDERGRIFHLRSALENSRKPDDLFAEVQRVADFVLNITRQATKGIDAPFWES
jgi:hypothetical protein